MSQMEVLVTNVAELLTTAVQEVLQLMGRAVLQYQEESARTRLENHNLQQMLRELQERVTCTSDEAQTVALLRVEDHSEEDYTQDLRDSVMKEESDNLHLKMVLDDTAVDCQHKSLQGSCDYSKKQNPLSMGKSDTLSIFSTSRDRTESPATRAKKTSVDSNRIKLESEAELLECSVSEDSDNVTAPAPDVLNQDALLSNEHNQQPVASSYAQFNKACRLLNSASKHVLRSRVENTGSVPSISERREFLYSCHVCGKRFATPSSLGAHFVCHTNERPFVCSCCKFSFSRLADLKKHERIHTGERPYNCSVCGRRFNRTGNLRRHMKKVHYGAVM